MKQQALLYPDPNPTAGDVRVMIHNGHEWIDMTGSVKDINFVSYTNSPWGHSTAVGTTRP